MGFPASALDVVSRCIGAFQLSQLTCRAAPLAGALSRVDDRTEALLVRFAGTVLVGWMDDEGKISTL